MRCPSCDHDNSSERRFCSECGTALAALASVGRLAEHSPEMALRLALTRFGRRFRAIESAVRASGRDIHGLTSDELETLWTEVKRAESA